MGHPRKIRKKYQGPSHPWEKTRIDEERILKKNFGLKKKAEIWKAVSELKRISNSTKRLIAGKSKGRHQTKLEEQQLLSRLVKRGLINEGDGLDIVLTLKGENLLHRRLQNLVYKNKLALTPKQARQFITHGHISVNGNKVTVPSFVVSVGDEISFNSNSRLSKSEHPERTKEKKEKVKSQEESEEVAPGEITEKDLDKLEKELVVEVEK